MQGFLNDYFSTPDSWTVETSGEKILGALNRWLYGQGQQVYGSAKGMVTTLSVLVIKSTTDGVHDFLNDATLKRLTIENIKTPEKGVEAIIRRAVANKSNDNLSAQIL